MEVVSYTDQTGRNAFDDWLATLDHQAFNRVVASVVRLAQGNLGDTKGVGDGVLERRIHAGPGYRIYFGRDGEELILLLTGGTKRGQDRDITRAKRLWQEYKKFKKGN